MSYGAYEPDRLIGQGGLWAKGAYEPGGLWARGAYRPGGPMGQGGPAPCFVMTTNYEPESDHLRFASEL